MFYSLAGYVYDKDNVLVGATVKYQGLFVKRLSGSSPTKFSGTKITDEYGYYSLNLGDEMWLGTTSSFGNGDEVLLMFWIPSGAERTSDALVQFAAYRLILSNVGSGNSHFQDVRLLANIAPVASFTLPATGYINLPVQVTNNSWDSPHTVDTVAGTSPVSMRQEYSYSGQSIFPICRIVRNDWDWKWLPTPGVDLETNNNPILSHTWTAIGDYTVRLSAEDASGARGNTTRNIRIKYPAPTPDFNWAPYPVGVNTDITFTESIGDPYRRVGTNTAFPSTLYKWYVKDPKIGPSFVYQSGFDNRQLIRGFTTNGEKWVRLEIYWNDGFANQTSYVDKKILISNTPPIPDFTVESQPKCAIDYLWSSTSYDPDGSIIYYEWNLYSLPGPNLLSGAGGPTLREFHTPITKTGTYRITLTVTDNDGGSDTKIVDFAITEITCEGESRHAVIDTMAVPGAYAVCTWLKKKPDLQAELIMDKDGKASRKMGGNLIDTHEDKVQKGIKWSSISIDQRPSNSS